MKVTVDALRSSEVFMVLEHQILRALEHPTKVRVYLELLEKHIGADFEIQFLGRV